MSWTGNSGLGSLDYQETIFTGLGSLDFPLKKFHRSWIAKSGLWSLTEKICVVDILKTVSLAEHWEISKRQ